MRALRWWSLLLVPGGFVAGHELGYQGASALGAPPVADGGHGYLSALALIGAPFAFAVLARSLLAGFRGELRPVRWRTLTGAQLALFGMVELVEHVHAGFSPAQTLAQPAVLLGLAAQLAVAGLVVLILRSSHEVAAALAAARTCRGAHRRMPARGRVPPPLVPLPVTVPVSSLSRRGPPLPLRA